MSAIICYCSRHCSETLVLLQHSKEGFEKSAIEASLNSLEFRLREFNTGGFPRGLSFMLGSLSRLSIFLIRLT